MHTFFLIDAIANYICFLIGAWMILSHKIEDGVLIKAGVILASLGCLSTGTNVMNGTDLPAQFEVYRDIGMMVMCIGVLFNVEVLPRLATKFPTLLYLLPSICKMRRVDDKH